MLANNAFGKGHVTTVLIKIKGITELYPYIQAPNVDLCEYIYLILYTHQEGSDSGQTWPCFLE